MKRSQMMQPIIEAVTNVKLAKMHNKLANRIDKDPTMKHRMMELDWANKDDIHAFCKDCFGEPKGLYINSVDEQAKLLRRFYDDYHKQSGSNFIRPEYDAIGF